jgi:hypothetical protein
MFDCGFIITLQAIRRQLVAMPHEIYLIRLIHHTTRRSFPGERLWTASQLGHAATVRFLRMRNREGCDIYIQPYAAQDRNAGYILVDLDCTNPAVMESMRANGHDPCVVLQTSPGHLQAWIHLTPPRWNPLWRRLPANSWPASMEGTWAVPTGVIWAGWLGSPIRSPSGAHPAVTLPG